MSIVIISLFLQIFSSMPCFTQKLLVSTGVKSTHLGISNRNMLGLNLILPLVTTIELFKKQVNIHE